MSSRDKLASATMGKYEFLGAGAVGGMGEVFAVRHRLLQELRAVKVMRGAGAPDQQLQERFILEARLSARLRHPNLVQLYDLAFHEDGTVYMVLEWIEGLDLAKILKRYGPPPLTDALEIARQALSALEYLHREGVVHRDVSGDNLMIVEKPPDGLEIKLIDLGIAKSIDTESGLTRRGLFVGKLHYAAPETLDSKTRPAKPDPRSDLYSFGVVLYEMLTGDSPITGTSESEILASHLLGSPRKFDETDPEGRVPEALRAIVLRCLEKAPSDRFQNAGELAQALASVQVEGRPQESTALREAITVASEQLRDLERSAALEREQEAFNRTMESESAVTTAADERGAAMAAGDLGGEVSTEREIWFDELRRSYVRRKKTSRLSTVVRLIQDHPRPVVVGTATLLLVVLLGLAGFLRGGEAPDSAATPSDAEGEVASIADSPRETRGPPPEPPAPPDEEAAKTLLEPPPQTVPPEEPSAAQAATLRAVVLISDNAQLTAAVLGHLPGNAELVVRQSLGEAIAVANKPGGPRRAIQLAVETQPGTLEAYETLIPTCRVVASGQILALPRGSMLFSRSVEATAPQCSAAMSQASRQLALELTSQTGLLQGGG